MLEALIAEQERLGLPDGQFARSMGIARQTWNHTRHHYRPLSPRIVRQAIKAYPHLMQAGIFFLLSDDTKSKDPATLSKTPSNIDASASERTRTLVLTNDRQTLACRETKTALPGQGESGLVVRSVPRSASKGYVMSRYDASALASRAADAEAG